MPNVLGMHSLVRRVCAPGYQGIGEIGKRVQQGAVHFLDYLRDKKGVLAERIVILQIYDDIFCGGVLYHLRQTIGGALSVRF